MNHNMDGKLDLPIQHQQICGEETDLLTFMIKSKLILDKIKTYLVGSAFDSEVVSAGLGSGAGSGTVSAGPGVATTEQRVIKTQECGICFAPKNLSSRDVGDKTVQFLSCGHTFHKGCTNLLFTPGRKKECPYCKKGFGVPVNLLYDTHAIGTDKESVFVLEICDICNKHKDFNADGKEKLQVLGCGHTYHKGCIADKMATGYSACPKCRKPIGEPKDIFYGGGYRDAHLVHKYLKYKRKYLQLKKQL